ncbi:6-phosphogluconolactonase [Lysobacter sp. A03]|uniref:6-phosphogluconolactonase n=1 Tax=Lysobacter sp. A03 TaxID=1199154 RepID=UPI0005B735B2|nr:6-phosphogluconolactonase [Lysobacter sp. A03]KIQ98025.1 6-phosphogluconolactonase, eukaryotic type [Lysobacter sp. A03]
MGWTLHTHADARQLAVHLVDSLQASLRAGLHERGSAMLALAGGSTPWPVYQRLAQATLEWQNVTLLPTDDRCVPVDSPASNLRGLAEAFAPANGVQLATLTAPDGDPDASLIAARAWLALHRQNFDAVVLGMGNDGHTASLFPGARQLACGYDPVLEACRFDPDPLPPEAPYPRITLTVGRLLRSDALHLLITGASKRAVLEEAIALNDPQRHPVMAVLGAPTVDVQIHWSP